MATEKTETGRSPTMENWSPLLVYEVGSAAHRERTARGDRARQRPSGPAHGQTPREALAAALIALALRIAPAPAAV